MNRILSRMLLAAAVAVVMFHGRARAQGASAPAQADAEAQTSLGHMLDFQQKLNEVIPNYELRVRVTLDVALNELLMHQAGIPVTINDAAFTAAKEKDLVGTTEIDDIGPMRDFTRATIVKVLLSKAGNHEMGTPTYILRRDHLEITTVGAVLREIRGERAAKDDNNEGVPVVPPLAYAAFSDTPLEDALKELARTTETTILLDPRTGGKPRVTAELGGVPLDAAVELLADMAGLKLVRVANVYYVTAPKNAKALQKEEDERRMGGGIRKADSTKPPMGP